MISRNRTLVSLRREADDSLEPRSGLEPVDPAEAEAASLLHLRRWPAFPTACHRHPPQCLNQEPAPRHRQHLQEQTGLFHTPAAATALVHFLRSGASHQWPEEARRSRRRAVSVAERGGKLMPGLFCVMPTSDPGVSGARSERRNSAESAVAAEDGRPDNHWSVQPLKQKARGDRLSVNISGRRSASD